MFGWQNVYIYKSYIHFILLISSPRVAFIYLFKKKKFGLLALMHALSDDYCMISRLSAVINSQLPQENVILILQ